MSKSVFVFVNQGIDPNAVEIDRESLIAALGIESEDKLIPLVGVERVGMCETGKPETMKYFPPIKLQSTFKGGVVVVEQIGTLVTTYAAETVEEVMRLRRHWEWGEKEKRNG